MATRGDIFSEISNTYPFGFNAPIINVSTAMPTPDSTKPLMADQNASPDKAPNAGGKIKFPAPKKIPNNNNPVNPAFLNMFFP